MKQLYIYIILLATIILGSCGHGHQERAHPQLKAKTAANYNYDSINHLDSNKLKQGLWVDYYDNGNVKTELCFKDNVKNGKCRWYWPEGELSAETEFNMGIIDGESIIYDRQGRLQMKTLFIMGRRKFMTEYNADGKVGNKEQYDNEGKRINGYGR